MSFTQSLHTWAALRAPVVKPRTQKYHQEIISTILRRWPEKCDVPGVEISAEEVAEFVTRIAGLSASRFNGIVTMLHATVPAAKTLKRRPLTVKERPLITQLEFSRLLAELDKRPRSHGGLVVRFLAHTGLRIHEARQLKWEHVKEDCIIAPASATKSGKARAIPFVNGVRETLAQLRSVTRRPEFVLPQSEVKRALQTACALAGVPRLSHHDFRHLFTTRCVESGVDIATVARWRGDRDGGAMLLKWYFHLLDAHSRRMAAQVSI